MASIIIEGHGGPKDTATNMDFGTHAHGDTTAHTRNLTIDNPGTKVLHWSAVISANGNWLTLSAMSGQVAVNSQATITSTAQTGSLAVGDYTADLTFALTTGNAQVNKLITATVTIASS